MPRQAKATTPSSVWTATQAYVLAAVCLLVGVAVGYLLRGSSTPDAPTATTASAVANAPAPAAAANASAPSSQQLAQMAQAQAGPLLQQLSASPNDPVLLAKIGNIYYDTQQYKDAIAYYEKSLKLKPDDVAVRTDMGTAYWYQGDADAALAQFQTALSYNPTYAETLFNAGVVKWQGKMDAKGAIQAWETLLRAHLDYPNRARVEELITKAREHAQGTPGS